MECTCLLGFCSSLFLIALSSIMLKTYLKPQCQRKSTGTMEWTINPIKILLCVYNMDTRVQAAILSWTYPIMLGISIYTELCSNLRSMDMRCHESLEKLLLNFPFLQKTVESVSHIFCY